MGVPTEDGSRKKLVATSAAVAVALERMVKCWMPCVSCLTTSQLTWEDEVLERLASDGVMPDKEDTSGFE